MNVLVNGTTLNVTNAYPERDEVTGIITYYIILPQSEMDYNDLKALFKSNSEEIVKNDDNGSVDLFAGAEYECIVDDDENGLYTVILNTNENKHQLARNRQLEADKARLESTVRLKEEEITELNIAVVEKGNKITEQEEAITKLNQDITSKDEEIATLAEQCAELLYANALQELLETLPEEGNEELLMEESEVE